MPHETHRLRQPCATLVHAFNERLNYKGVEHSSSEHDVPCWYNYEANPNRICHRVSHRKTIRQGNYKDIRNKQSGISKQTFNQEQ